MANERFLCYYMGDLVSTTNAEGVANVLGPALERDESLKGHDSPTR